jgi:hypothetical protein
MSRLPRQNSDHLSRSLFNGRTGGLLTVRIQIQGLPRPRVGRALLIPSLLSGGALCCFLLRTLSEHRQSLFRPLEAGDLVVS